MLSTVFHIFVKKMDPDYINLWNPGTRSATAGSGFGIIINDVKYIMTNSHVIENSNFIECTKYNSDKRYVLNIVDIAFELDLALLITDQTLNNDFWNDINISKIVYPPPRGHSIKVVGFPQNGINPSITSGIINRIIPIPYNKIFLNLAIQVDSAINPGNSGGPVFNDDNEIVGIAFSHSMVGQNICYIIPSFIILHYVETKKKFNQFPGICDFDIVTVSLENEFIRKYYLDDDKISGILVTQINPIGTANHLFKNGDVIYKIDDISINNDQTILFENYRITKEISKNIEKIPYWHILRLKLPGDSITVSIIRNKQHKTVNFKIGYMVKKLIPALSSHISRKYYIFGGLIFIPLNFWYLFKIESNKPGVMDTDKYNLLRYLDDYPNNINDEIVILMDILQSPLTVGYKLNDIKLIKINDTIVNNLHTVYNICENSDAEFIKFEFENNKIIILNRQSKTQSENITQKYLKISYHNEPNL